jgi:hypothetical protein
MSEERKIHLLNEKVDEKTGRRSLYLNGKLIAKEFIDQIGNLEVLSVFGSMHYEEKIQYLLKQGMKHNSANACVIGPASDVEFDVKGVKAQGTIYPIEYYKIWEIHLKQLLDGRECL